MRFNHKPAPFSCIWGGGASKQRPHVSPPTSYEHCLKRVEDAQIAPSFDGRVSAMIEHFIAMLVHYVKLPPPLSNDPLCPTF